MKRSYSGSRYEYTIMISIKDSGHRRSTYPQKNRYMWFIRVSLQKESNYIYIYPKTTNLVVVSKING